LVLPYICKWLILFIIHHLHKIFYTLNVRWKMKSLSRLNRLVFLSLVHFLVGWWFFIQYFYLIKELNIIHTAWIFSSCVYHEGFRLVTSSAVYILVKELFFVNDNNTIFLPPFFYLSVVWESDLLVIFDTFL